jgi:hypothetical protein
MDSIDFIMTSFWSFFLGVIVIAIVIVCIDGNSQPVDVNSFGTSLCESKGLVYNNYTWKEGVSHVPVIHCKQNNTQSVYDGVVVLDGVQ